MFVPEKISAIWFLLPFSILFFLSCNNKEMGNVKKGEYPVKGELLEVISENIKGGYLGDRFIRFNVRLENLTSDSVMVFGSGSQFIEVVGKGTNEVFDSILLPPYPYFLAPFSIDSMEFSIGRRFDEKEVPPDIFLYYTHNSVAMHENPDAVLVLRNLCID